MAKLISLSKKVLRRVVKGKSNLEKSRSYYDSEYVDDRLILLEASRGTAVNGNIFSILYNLEKDPKWNGYKWYFVITKATEEEAKRKFSFYGFTKVKTVYRESEEYVKLLARSKYLFSDNTFPVYYIKKDEQVLNLLWHGTPLKKLGGANLASASGLGNVQRNYFMASNLLFPNEHTKNVFLRDYQIGFNCQSNILMMDYPRNDFLHRKESRSAIRDKLKISDKTVFAYMPTWRGTGSNVNTEDNIRQIKQYLHELDKKLKDQQVLYVNLHHFVASGIEYDDYKRIFPFPKEYETYDFLSVSDVLVTDYSSVMFDYACTGRPVILFVYDHQDYYDERGAYFTLDQLPFKKCYDLKELTDCIQNRDYLDHDENNKEYKDMQMKFCNYSDPHTTDKFLDFVINGKEKGIGLIDSDKTSENSDKHVFVAASLENGLPERIMQQMKDAVSDGSDVCVVVEKGLKASYFHTLEELNRNGIYYYTLVKSYNDNLIAENKRLFGNWSNIPLTIVSGSKKISKIAKKISTDKYDFCLISKLKISKKNNDLILSFCTKKDFSAIRLNYDHVLKLNKAGSNKYKAVIPLSEDSSFDTNNIIELLDSDNNPYFIVYNSILGAKMSMYRNRFVHFKDLGLTAYFLEQASNIKLMIRPENTSDKKSELLKITIAFVCNIINPFKTKGVLLFEKNSEKYEESASVIFEELINRNYKNVFFVLDRHSEAYSSIPQKYRSFVIDKYSFKHYRMIFSSKLFLSTESVTHVIDKRAISIFIRYWRQRMKFNYVFLQHGVMFMVSLDAGQRSFFRTRFSNGIKRTVVSSQLEKQHFVEYGGFDPDSLYLCGLPKFDRAKRNETHDRIVIMPTWKPWEENMAKVNFYFTDYFKSLEKMYNQVPDHLKEKTIVLPHPLFAAIMNEEDAPHNMKIYAGDNYNEILQETSLLITDYSSISYDAFYRGANIIFYWENIDETISKYGRNAKLMLSEDLAFGDICYKENDLSALIENNYEQKQKEEYVSRFRKLVEFNDNHNSERLIEFLEHDGII